jgi:hypothetical protein
MALAGQSLGDSDKVHFFKTKIPERVPQAALLPIHRFPSLPLLPTCPPSQLDSLRGVFAIAA